MVDTFKQTMIRLLSLVSAMMLTQLEGKDTLTGDSGYNILDVSSLEMAKIRMLAKDEKKGRGGNTMDQGADHRTHQLRGHCRCQLRFLTRVFQELDLSMGKYHEAERFSQIPFPFPFAATLDLIMVLHTITTPFVIMNLTGDHAFLPIAITALTSFIMWNLHLIPGEFENPYDGDMNDLDMQGLQDDLNAKLLATCSVPPGSVARPQRVARRGDPPLGGPKAQSAVPFTSEGGGRSKVRRSFRGTLPATAPTRLSPQHLILTLFVAFSGASVVTPETCVKTDGTDSAPSSVPILQNERVEFPSAVQADLDQFTRSSDPSDLSPLPTTQTAQTLSPPPKLDFTTEGSTVCPCAPASPVAEGHNL